MSMTKKDFEAIARAIQNDRKHWSAARGYDMAEIEGALSALSSVGESIATYCQQANPQFNRARFLAACGIESEREREAREAALRG